MAVPNLEFNDTADLDAGYQEFVFDDSQEFEDIRRYSLSNNPSSPSIQSQLSQNPSSPMSQQTLSSNSSSPVIRGRISHNTSSPAVSNTEVLDRLETDNGGNMYDDGYESSNISPYGDYQNLTSGIVNIGLNEEEDEWQIQSLKLPEEMHQKEIEEALESIQKIIEELEDIEFEELDKDDLEEI